jgi:hypothetical protein
MSLAGYLENGYFADLYNVGLHGPNRGFYSDEKIRYVGMMAPPAIVADEHHYVALKKGQPTGAVYTGGLIPFGQKVTAAVQRDVQQCMRETNDPLGCQSTMLHSLRR